MDSIEHFILSSEENPPNTKKITFLNSIQDSIAIGSWEVDLEKTKVIWSSMTKTIHEVDDDFEPKFDGAIDFFPEGKYRDRILDVFERAVTLGEKYDVELQFLSAKKNLKWVRSVGYPVFENGKCVKVKGVFQDITESKNRANEVSLKEKQLRATWESSPNGMAILNLDGRLETVNKSFCRLLEYTENELRALYFNDLIHPEDLVNRKSEIEHLISGKLDYRQKEKRMITKTGKLIFVLCSSSVVRDTEGKALNMIINIANITQNKKAEDEIKMLLKTTEQQNMRLLNFAHIVSHNLRSHTGNLEMLLNLLKDEFPEATRNDYFPLINDAVNNLSETISHLNEVSTTNTKNHELESLNLLEYTNKAISSIKALAIETDANIIVDIDKGISILGIPAYLDSILLNFLTNAIKYRRQDVKPIIELSAKKEDKLIKFNIEDNGLGIDLEQNGHKLFGMYKVFHRHDDARGLGLFISKNQIDAIGGSVEVKSEVNKGTTFSIYFQYE
ncbi:PAS domain-containing sensor histidine kinase [Sediminibacter sp. Hel_I_10]|uniref:PAS domain-containing sensor histidine kinase n=1 Tax=Sediminibacter sp. Hel_I_10 TaxID=1392490 RepID=UPI00068AB76F|nr:PAS domain-containing sensor histidine kinase [Sediminibacter sp. Hel_I_10]